MIIDIVLLVAVIFAILVVVIALRPAEFVLTRTALMAAAPSAVFAQINDFHRWEAWSPWAKMDPAAKNRYEGPAAGKDASMSWSGNSKVGEGRMTIVESKPDERIQIQLEFFKPFKATNRAEFTFKPESGQTRVSWSMRGENKFIGKAMSLFCNFDKMVGGQFDQGLDAIKSIVETK